MVGYSAQLIDNCSRKIGYGESFPTTARLHDSVYERLALSQVRNFTSYAPYRPVVLRNHEKAKPYYAPTP